MNNKKTAIVLLSGGLDSVISAYKTQKEKADIKHVLFFNYGQKAYIEEKKASKYFAKRLNATFTEISLPFLEEITGTSLVNKVDTPEMNFQKLQDKEYTTQSMLDVWVPNRNGLFINIAAAFCESKNYDYIVCGFNFEEAQTFPDNSIEFVNSMNNTLKYSTLKRPEVISPFYNKNKKDIVKSAIELNIELNKIYSCYNGLDKQCGNCESCIRFKKALQDNNIDYTGWFEI